MHEHVPVLLTEVLSGLACKLGDVVVDGTAGSGSHAAALLEAVGSQGRLVAIDRDQDAIKRCQERFCRWQDRVSIWRGTFSELDRALESLGIKLVDRILLDLGVSREQFMTPERGFGFRQDGPLDMRMDLRLGRNAEEIVNQASERDLSKIFWDYGQERHARFLARRIAEVRRRGRIRTTQQLAELVRQTVRHRMKIHPATRIFQALRIAVNNELGEIQKGLEICFGCLKPEGRLAVISYHSLEDRAVKEKFRAWKQAGKAAWICKKPITPSFREIKENLSARSAKLRLVERII